MEMSISIDRTDIKTIKEFAEKKLSQFLVNNLSDFNHYLFILQSIMDKLKEAEEYINEE